MDPSVSSSTSSGDGSDSSDTKTNCDNMKQKIAELLEHFGKNTYAASNTDQLSADTLQDCINLFRRDYNISLIDNRGGVLCSHYPSHIVIIDSEKIPAENDKDDKDIPKSSSSEGTSRDTDSYEFLNAKEAILHEMFMKAMNARCRSRFVVPVMHVNNKYICRSATLSGCVELFGKKLLSASGDWLKKHVLLRNVMYDDPEQADTHDVEVDDQLADEVNAGVADSVFDDARFSDRKLLKEFKVTSVFDLMVENKKVKYKMYFSSSEKIDKKNRYEEFKLICAPYPGCEFFAQFKENSHDGTGLLYNWDSPMNDAKMNIIQNPNTANLNINWDDYKKWDLIQITSNYMKYLLKYIEGSEGGILIHCISGWDRTPLFISMVRLCLWADGLIHKSLDEYEIIYLTVGYDWYCFGHQLSNRLAKNEDVFFFCFYMMQYLAAEEFSLLPRPPEAEAPAGCSTPRSKSKVRAEKVKKHRTISEDEPMVCEDDKENSNVTNVISSAKKASLLRSPMKRSAADVGSSMEPHGSKRRSVDEDPADFTVVENHVYLIPQKQFEAEKESKNVDLGPLDRRKKRLMKVFDIFLKCYFSTIGRDSIQYAQASG